MKYGLLNVKNFQKNFLFYPEIILRPLFCFKVRKNTGLLIFNSLKQRKLIFNFFVNRNWKNLTDSRKRAEILADNRKRQHPIENLTTDKAQAFDPSRPTDFGVCSSYPLPKQLSASNGIFIASKRKPRY